MRDELAGLANSFDRYAGGKGSDLQSWLSMNDAGPLLVDRKTSCSTFVERASVSLLGAIQLFTLESVFGVSEREAGLLARVLLAYPPDRPALWSDSELPDEVVAGWQDLLAALLGLEPARDDAGRPRPPFIGLAGEARRAFIAWHDRHARDLADLVDDHLRAHWSKLKGSCARIALLFACAEAVDQGPVASVSRECLERAIRVTEWLKQESTRIYSGLGEPKEDRERRRLVEWIAGRGGTATVRDLTHGIRAFRGDSDGARTALDDLAKLGLGRWSFSSPSAQGGRTPERFELMSVAGVTVTETSDGDAVKGGFGDGDSGDAGGGKGVSGPGSEAADPPVA